MKWDRNNNSNILEESIKVYKDELHFSYKSALRKPFSQFRDYLDHIKV